MGEWILVIGSAIGTLSTILYVFNRIIIIPLRRLFVKEIRKVVTEVTPSGDQTLGQKVDEVGDKVSEIADELHGVKTSVESQGRRLGILERRWRR